MYSNGIDPDPSNVSEVIVSFLILFFGNLIKKKKTLAEIMIYILMPAKTRKVQIKAT
jgi:hypothetical protein